MIPGLLTLIWATTGWAANNNLQFGPAPSWVKATPTPAAGAATQAAIKVLLADHQVELTPRTIKHYVESVVSIQTPQGLSAIGTITLLWNPDTDVLTVHKIHILRGQKVIDVLGSGQTFTIARRETNLDYASLDDTLTAILQPADLQVGDTLDIAYTLERTDPVLAGASADEVEISPELPISELHISAHWPSTYPVKWQATDGLTGVRQTHDGDTSGIELTMSDVEPVLEPKQAPLRFLVDRRIDFSGSASWDDVAKQFTPLFEHAARLSPGSPLQAEIARIKAAAPDPKARASLALQLVEDKVRYVFLAMNNGGLVPADADQTWSRRYGDCKGKTVLLLALLHALGIEARPVVVNVRFGDGLDARLPMAQIFDHVLVEATIGGKTYWLDGTRLGDRGLDHLHVPYYHWGLPLDAGSAALVKMVPAPLGEPLSESTISMDASGGVTRPVAFHVEAVIHDYPAVVMQQRLVNLTPPQLDSALRAFWSQQYDFVTISSVAATFDEKNEIERMTMDGTAKLDWSGGQYAPVGLAIGYDANLERQPGPHQDAPFSQTYPIYDSNTVTIKLPLGGKGFSITGANVDRTLAATEYRRHTQIKDGVFTGVSSTRTVAPEFSAAEAPIDQQALRDLSKANLDIDAPAGHTPTAEEIKGGLPQSNSDADDYGGSGWILWQRREFDAAFTDFDAGLALDAHNAVVLGNRGLAYFYTGQYERAQSDFDAALATDPHAWVALNGRGLLALHHFDGPAAIAAFSEAIKSNPKDEFALEYRGSAYWRTGKKDLALADFDEAIRQRPASIALYWPRAVILKEKGKSSDGIRQAQLVTGANPKSPAAYFTAAEIYTAFHDNAKANASLDKAVAVAPVAQTYLMRAGFRLWTDLPDKRADIESALKLDPKSARALMMLAEVQVAAGQYKEAAGSLTEAMNHSVVDSEFLVLRGIAYEKAGQTALAATDFAGAQARAKYPVQLNDVCWFLATAGLSFDSALADCKAAVGKKPQSVSFQDSLGFVLLRLHQYPAAIAAYDAALRLDPLQTDSLYGRGICELRSGDISRGHADIEEAKGMSLRIADEFAHYGVKP
jgi:tetratricopeptide (TPR) repeat protein/transglutaminase-like putative cysteine protease